MTAEHQMPEFPVDDETLDLIAACLEPDGPSLTGVLDVLSGYDESKVVDIEDGIKQYVGGRLYVVEDVVQSLLAEVRRLRSAAAWFAPSASPAPTGRPGLLVTLCAATGAVLGAYIGWHAAGRRT